MRRIVGDIPGGQGLIDVVDLICGDRDDWVGGTLVCELCRRACDADNLAQRKRPAAFTDLIRQARKLGDHPARL